MHPKLMPLLSDESSMAEEVSAETPPGERGRTDRDSTSTQDPGGIDYDRTEDSFGEHPLTTEKVELR
jgi:hypothetical protein